MVAGHHQENRSLRSPSVSLQQRKVRSALPTRRQVSGQPETPLLALSRLETQYPHEIFVWDPNGEYVDASYPNPVHGHFLNSIRLKGARVRDLFPRLVSARLLQKIMEAWRTGSEKSTGLTFEREGQQYEARVICVPTQEGRIIGLVTDRLLGPSRSLWPQEQACGWLASG